MIQKMDPETIDGRFLPSRVFHRWKWVVRTSLSIIPLVLFLSGSLRIYLSPAKFSSSTVFEVINGPALREIEEYLRTGDVISRAVDHLQIQRQLQMDRDLCVSTLRENLETEIFRDTHIIRLQVTLSSAVIARDVAEELPKSLVADLTDTLTARSEQRIAEIRQLESVAADRAKEVSTRWIKLQEVHGPSPENAGAAIAIENARSATHQAEAEMAKWTALVQEEQTQRIHQQPRLVVHTKPQIANNPVDSRQGHPLGMLVLECIGWALALALALPYLLELLFPNDKRQPMATAAAFEV